MCYLRIAYFQAHFGSVSPRGVGDGINSPLLKANSAEIELNAVGMIDDLINRMHTYDGQDL